MNITFGVKNYLNNAAVNKTDSKNNSLSAMSRPAFKGSASNRPDGLTPEQAQALAAQKLAEKQNIPHITEKDINFEVTCVGHSQVEGNTREIYDYRCSMQAVYGIYWYKNFKTPHIVRNGNLDEKRNGETTAIVFPLNPKTPGLRGADHMAMVLSGRIETPLLDELVKYMSEIGILNSTPIAGIKYYVNSLKPNDFMANPTMKTAIAHFFQKKEAERANAAAGTQTVNNDSKDAKLRLSDINIVNIGQKTDKNNTREVKDYLREFLKNGKKFTVVHDQYTQNNQEKDMTAILIPSPKSDWDCITVTIDKKISEQECKNLINHLVRNKMANVEHENFRAAIVEYLNNIEK